MAEAEPRHLPSATATDLDSHTTSIIVIAPSTTTGLSRRSGRRIFKPTVVEFTITAGRSRAVSLRTALDAMALWQIC
jgi:hypothetical protein